MVCYYYSTFTNNLFCHVAFAPALPFPYLPVPSLISTLCRSNSSPFAPLLRGREFLDVCRSSGGGSRTVEEISITVEKIGESEGTGSTAEADEEEREGDGKTSI
jgi:hypothetical protein